MPSSGGTPVLPGESRDRDYAAGGGDGAVLELRRRYGRLFQHDIVRKMRADRVVFAHHIEIFRYKNVKIKSITTAGGQNIAQRIFSCFYGQAFWELIMR